MAIRLSGRSANHTQIRADHPLSDNEIRSVAPSIYATEAHSSRSERYAYIPTIDVLNALRNEGFQPFCAAQARVNSKGLAAGKQNFTRHMLRLRHPDAVKTIDGAHEIILMNSHDGTSSYQMLAGVLRFVCMNGMVCGNIESEVRILHKGASAVDDVIEGAYRVLSTTKDNQGMIEDMQSTIMPVSHQIAFANAAIGLRFGEGSNVITASQMLESRRSDDNGNDQWSVFNRVQENAVKGGMIGRSSKGRPRSVRAISGMDKDTTFNRQLWRMMEAIRAA